jgi:6-phosphogluconolactonase
MKRYRIGRAALATMMSLALGLGITACSRDYTVSYVYATSAQTGLVSAFDVDFQSGTLVQIAGSPFTSQLHNPVSLAVSPNSKNLYVIGGSQDNQLTWMAIGTDGKLYGQKQYAITGSSPTGVAIDPSGSFLFVTFTLQNIYTTVAPGPGGMTIYPIGSDGSLGAPVTQNLGLNPVGVAIGGLQACNPSTATPGTTLCSNLPAPCADSSKAPAGLCHLVYVVDADQTSTGVGNGQVLGFIQTDPTGLLTPLPGTVITSDANGRTSATGYLAGTTPTAIAADPASHFIYVTDRALNQLLGYQVMSPSTSASGSLVALKSNPTSTGQYPVAVTIDPRGKFLYVANFGASTVSAFALDAAGGSPTGVAGTGNGGATSTGPTCVTIEPALGIYLYTSTQLSGQISGMQLDPHTGSLSNIENTPFDAGPLLSCVAAAANGEHATSLVTP